MSAVAAAPAGTLELRGSARRLDGAGVRVGVFAAMSLYASLEYAGLLEHAPRLRVLALVALVSAGCALLAAAARVPARVRLALSALLALATLALALLAAGVPAHLLAPSGWAALGREVGHGVDALGAWLWPYRGGDAWARRDVMLVLPVTLVLAGLLCFWPAGGALEARRTMALLLLLALYLAGVANTPAHLDGLRGLVLLAFVAAWLWLPGLRVAQAPRAARWLLACALVALLLRPLVSSPSSWIAYREASSGPAATATFQWDQLYGPISWSRSPATMFEIATPRPVLLRVTSLDRFDGLRFLRSSAPPGSRRLDLPHARLGGAVHSATISVAGLRSSLLVAGGGVALGARWLGHGSPRLRRAADGTVSAPLTVGAGALYRVSSYVPRATAPQLRAAPRAFPRRYLPYVQFELPGRQATGLAHPNLLAEERARPTAATIVGPPRPGLEPGADPAVAARIEGSPYGPMYALVRRLQRGAGSSYEVAERIQAYLLARYRYSERVSRARYPLEAFLFSQHAGYCQQFSGAMTLMLRMAGIPARVGAGFEPVLFDARAGAWRVRALDAHAWVEVFFSGIGWVTFDPTPEAPIAAPAAEGARNKTLVQSGAAASAVKPSAPAAAVTAPLSAAGRSGGPSALLVAAALLVILAAALACLWLAGRARLRRALSGEAQGAVEELRLALLRLQPSGAHRPAPTLAELERRLCGQRHERAAEYLRALARARYAPAGVGAGPSPRGRAALRRALAAADGRPALRRRLRALAQLPPGIARGRGVSRPAG